MPDQSKRRKSKGPGRPILRDCTRLGSAPPRHGLALRLAAKKAGYRLTPSDLLVWGVVRQAYRHGYRAIEAGLASWCAATGLSARTIQRSWVRLKTAGLVERRPRWRPGDVLRRGRAGALVKYRREKAPSSTVLTSRGRRFTERLPPVYAQSVTPRSGTDRRSADSAAPAPVESGPVLAQIPPDLEEMLKRLGLR